MAVMTEEVALPEYVATGCWTVDAALWRLISGCDKFPGVGWRDNNKMHGWAVMESVGSSPSKR
jgi:hypothetical protein